MSAKNSQRCVIDFDHTSETYRDNFERLAHDLRAQGDLLWSDHHDGFWIPTRIEQVAEIMRCPANFSSDHDPEGLRNGYQGLQIPEASKVRAGFIEMDPPEHFSHRRIVNPYMSPAAVERWRPLAEDLTNACLNDVLPRGQIDFVKDISNVVPSVLTMAMLGLPLADWVLYYDTIHGLLEVQNGSPEHAALMVRFGTVLERLMGCIAAERETPRRGILNALIEAEVDGQPLDDATIAGTVVLVMSGGFDTTTSLIARTMEWLDRNRDAIARLRDEAELLDPATEEFLRYVTPIQNNARTVAADIEFEGQQLHAGDRMLVPLALANRDPDAFESPDEVRLERFPNRHASFGFGPHRCIGSNVARMVFQVVVKGIVDRIPDFEVDRDAARRYASIGTINGYSTLPASFKPRPATGPNLQEVVSSWQSNLDAEVPDR